MDRFPWLTLIFMVIAVLYSLNENFQNKSGKRPLNSSPSPWAHSWRKSENFSQFSEEKYVETEGTSSTEGSPGVEGTAGDEGSSAIESTIRMEETPRQEQTSELKVIHPLKTKELFLDTRPTDEDLIRAVVWAEILGKPKAMKTRK